MADDKGAARREARRQRILQNSQARLEKIAGRSLNGPSATTREDEQQNGPVNTQEDNDIFGFSSPQPRRTNAHFTLANNLNIEREIRETTPVERFFKQIWEDEAISEYNGDFSARRDTTCIDTEVDMAPTGNKYVSFATSLRLHFVILAILVCILFHLDFGFLFGETICIPFLILEMSNLLVLKMSKQSTLHSSGVIGAVLILCGISPNVVNPLIEIKNAIFIIGADFSMYFVCFVLFHCAIEEFNYLSSIVEHVPFFK